jgi:DNA-binding MarR family transcriptional regulator
MSNSQRLYALIRQIRPVYRTLYRAVEDGLAGSGLTVGDRAVLECLRDQGSQTVPEIASLLDLERQPVQRIVDRLAQGRYIERTSNPRSLKSHKIALTSLGSRTIERVLEQEGKSLRRVAKSVDAGELEIAIKVIAQITTGFGLRKDR